MSWLLEENVASFSVETTAAIAPFPKACSTKSWPSIFSPRTAKKSSLGRMVRESMEYPVAITSAPEPAGTVAPRNSAIRLNGSFMRSSLSFRNHGRDHAALLQQLAGRRTGHLRCRRSAHARAPFPQSAQCPRARLRRARDESLHADQVRSCILLPNAEDPPLHH